MKRLLFIFLPFFVCTSVFAQNNGFTESDRQLLIQMDKRLTVLENRVADMEKSNQLRFEQVEKSNQQRFELMDKPNRPTDVHNVSNACRDFRLDRFCGLRQANSYLSVREEANGIGAESILAKDHEITRKALREEALQNPVLKDILIRLGIF
jgi:hypothetical protein